MYKTLIRPLLFNLDPEQAHSTVLRLAALSSCAPVPQISKILLRSAPKSLGTSFLGLDFPSPLGLAAGFDKDAVSANFLATLGFGFLELGTVAPRAQPGNEKPRVFRLSEDRALINRLGFPSAGVDEVTKNLERVDVDIPVLINIGKARDTELDEAARDYVRVFERIAKFADLIVVNVSSPNTPGLRTLQQAERLGEILNALQASNEDDKAILVKIAPDLEWPQLEELVDCCIQNGVAALIACNTTSQRTGLKSKHRDQAGGLSGRPLFARSCEVVRYLHQTAKIPTIAVGGVSSVWDVLRMITSGASLVQCYTALVYQGPFFPRRVNQELNLVLNKLGVSSIGELIGQSELSVDLERLQADNALKS